jgi:lysylphosphatidylglycerol synthetase-like protein (DUF2156 family)
MFNLEQAIADWRQQMLAAGIKAPTPLEELEGHLREDIERQLKSGLGEQKAFEISASRIGQPEILGSEFKTSEGTLLKVTGIFAAIAGTVIISRILTEHPDAEHLREKEQTAWLIAGSIIVLCGIGMALIKAGSDRGVVRLCKLIGVGYSIFTSGFSISLTTICLVEPKISSAFTITDWILVFAANMASIFSIAGLRQGCRLSPVVQNSQVRMTIGMVCPLVGALWMLAYIVFIIPHQLQSWVNHFFAMLLWALAVMSLLGGIGYGLAEAAGRKQTGPADS